MSCLNAKLFFLCQCAIVKFSHEKASALKACRDETPDILPDGGFDNVRDPFSASPSVTFSRVDFKRGVRKTHDCIEIMILKRKFAVILCFTLFASFALAEDSKLDDVKEAFKGIKDKLSALKDNSIVKKVVVYGQVIGHSAVAVKNTVELIKSLMGAQKESKELVFMREQFAIINTKLDALDYDFIDVKNMIDWSVMKVNIGAYERSIRSLQKKLTDYLQAPPAAAKFFQDMFVNDYIRNYGDAALKVYVALAKDSAIFQDNLFKISRKQLKEDLKKVCEFTGYILRIIERGVTLEHAYLTAVNRTDAQAALTKDWERRFKDLEGVAVREEKAVKGAWITQFRQDADEFAVRNAHLNNRDMATSLFQFFQAKYPWRWWFVFVYTFTNHNDKDRYYENCGHTFVKANVGNKVVIVNSLDPNYPRRPDPGWFINSVYSRMGGFSATAKLAKLLYQRSASGCHLYKFKGVFELKSNPSFWAPSGRFFGREVQCLRDFHSWKGYKIFMLV